MLKNSGNWWLAGAEILGVLVCLYFGYYFMAGFLACLTVLGIPIAKTATPLHKKLERPTRWIDRLPERRRLLVAVVLLIVGILFLAAIVGNFVVFSTSTTNPDPVNLVLGILTAAVIVPCAFFLKSGFVLLKGESLYHSLKESD